MKKKQKVQIFKLEERVLFDGAAAAEIVAAVNNAGDANNADQGGNDSDQDQDQEQQEKFIQSTVQAAGPVDTPDPSDNVQTEGEGLPQADAAQNDPVEVLINGSADFTQPVDVNADADAADHDPAADLLSSSADADASDASELIVLDHDAADQIDLNVLEGKNVLVLDGDSDAADQIEDWLSDHDDQQIDSVLFVSDSDSDTALDSLQLDHAELETISLDDFQSSLDDAPADDLVIMPDHDVVISVDTDADAGSDLPDALADDAADGRHELVILNSSTADLDNVLDQLGDSREVLVIDNTADAFGQISDYLNHSDTAYDAVHILTHGNDEGFYLGSQKVIAADQMAVFDGHMAENGDFMLYGCNLAATDQGQALVNDIAAVTGCDVAASTDTTGAESLNGNWMLEYSSGTIDTASISLDASWGYQLKAYTIDVNADASETNFKTTSLAGDAIAAIVKSGNTLELKNDVTGGGATWSAGNFTFTCGSYSISGTLTITGGSANKPFVITGGTFNGTLTVSGGVVDVSSTKFENAVVNNGTIVGSASTSTGVNISGSGSWGSATAGSFALSATGGMSQITGTGDFQDATLSFSSSASLMIPDTYTGVFSDSSINISGTGSLTIHGGTFALSSSGSGLTIISASGKSAVYISGGTFSGTSTQGGTGISFTSTDSLSIEGGTFSDFNEAVIFNASSKTASCDITAGEFSDNVYAITNSGSGTLSVTGNADIHDNYKTGSSISSGAGIRNTGSGLLHVYSLTNPIDNNYYGIHNTGSNSDSSISSVTISNNYGSGIRNEGTLDSVFNVALSNNGLTTDTSDCFTTLGGGIYNSGTIKVLEYTNIIGNHALTGGGIYNTGNIGEGVTGYVDHVYVSGNEAVRGGGIYQSGGYFMFTDVRQLGVIPLTNGSGDAGLEGNTAHQGAGIYIAAGNFLMTGFTVSGNTARWIQKSSDDTMGGGIYVASGATVTLDSVTVTGNTVESQDMTYDPSYWKYYYNDPSLDIDDIPPATDIGGKGGGIYNAGTLKIVQSEISENEVQFTNTRQLPDYYAYLATLAMGGGIYSNGTLSVYDSYIHDNTATNGNGGGVYVASGSASFVSTEYLTGSGLWGQTAEGYTENSMIISGNTAISSSDGTKYAAGGFGGGIYADSSANLTLDSVTVADNTATLSVVTDTASGTKYDLSRGGGVYFGEAYLYQVDSKNTTAPTFGSGTFKIDGSVRDWNQTNDLSLLAVNQRPSQIFNNSAVAGGGVYVTGAGTGTIRNTEIYNNDYTVPGTADSYFTNVKTAEQQFKLLVETSNQQNTSLTGKPTDLSPSQISAAGQLFTARGDGLYFGGTGMTLSLDLVSVYGNDSPNHDALGGGIYATGSLFNSSTTHLNIVNATLYDNSGDAGAGLYINDKAVVNVLDTTIAGNTALTFGGGVFITGDSASVSILNSILVGNTAEGNANDLTSAMDTITVKDKYSLFGSIWERNSNTLQYVEKTPDSTSQTGLTVAEIFTGGSLETAWGNVGEIYSKTSVVGGQIYTVSEYSYTTHTLSINTTGPAASGGVYTAINTSSSTMYYNTTAPAELSEDVTSGWLTFSSGSSASVSSDYIVAVSQNGRARLIATNSSYSIGAYSLESISTIVNTFIDDSIAGNKYYSLREAITSAAGGSTKVVFDTVALQVEIDNKGFMPYFLLDSALALSSGSITLDFSKLSELVLPTGSELSIVRTGNFTDTSSSMFVLSETASLTMSDIRVYGNNVLVDTNGAAINAGSGTTLKLSNVKIQGAATSADGGAIYAASDATVSLDGENTFSDNTAANGGAIYAASGSKLSLPGTITFTDNSALEDGGAFYNAADSITIKSLGFSGNSATNGGAIYNTTDLTVSFSDDGSFVGNIANGAGGAIYNIGTVTVTGDFSGNEANSEGGAIYNAETGTVTVTGDLFGNEANATGGAIYNDGTATVTGNISGNSAMSDGGAVYNTGTVTVTGDLFGNEANANGGAIYNTGTATITGNISGSSATSHGGAIYNTGTATITGDLTGNSANGYGGAIYSDGGTLTVLGNITDGTANKGSVAYVNSGAVRIGDLDHYIELTGNDGSLVEINDGDILITNALVKENSSDTELFTVTGGTLTILNSTVTGNDGNILNVTGNDGNILNVTAGTAQIADSTVAFNSDGAQITNNGTLNVVNSIVIADNDFTVTNEIAGVINEAPEDVFLMSGADPVVDLHGTLKISISGLAIKDGVMVGYKADEAGTVLYYTTDGETWQPVDGASPVEDYTVVETAQNEAARLLSADAYEWLNIGAYAMGTATLPLVVTISGDTPAAGETTLREALEYAAYMYESTGETKTVSFKVSEVYLDETITVTTPVNISGSGVTITVSENFTDETLIVVDGDSAVSMSGVTIDGNDQARGIELNSGDLSLSSVTIQNGYADGNGGGILAHDGSVSGSKVTFTGNTAADGAAIYAEDATVSLSGFTVTNNTATDGGIITSESTADGVTVSLRDGTISGNDSPDSLVSAEGAVSVVTVTAAQNEQGAELLTASSADIVNSTLTGAPGDGAYLVDVANDLNVANSIIVTYDQGTPSVKADFVRSAYSIYSGSPSFGVNDSNVTGQSVASVFGTDNLQNGQLAVADGSLASLGVWTQYNPDTREISYSVRPDGVWTERYSPERMQWRYLGGGSASYSPAYLVGRPGDYPSVGAYWVPGGQNHPDYGPGVNTTKINPSYKGLLFDDWGYNSVVNGYWLDPHSSLISESESGSGWYASMLSELFGYRYSPADNIAVLGMVPDDAMDLSVDGVQEDFDGFQEAPYRADDGSPLSPEEQEDLRKSITLNRRLPEDTLNLSDAVHQQVASSLRSAELFKDSFDKALETLLGQDA
ncbi:MAG: DUF4347 domain-containing protein [Lentisphaeria bacterium]|nr:DUF4347 domain-containing protein [Lentisphaeria bacterium]